MYSDANTSSKVKYDVRSAFSEYSVMITRDSSIGGKHSEANAESSSRVGSSTTAFEEIERWPLMSRFGMTLLRSATVRVETVDNLRSLVRLSLGGPQGQVE